jgi:hypothetical protein
MGAVQQSDAAGAIMKKAPEIRQPKRTLSPYPEERPLGRVSNDGWTQAREQ